MKLVDLLVGPVAFLYTLKAAGPPHFWLLLPLQAISHLDSSSWRLVSSLPQKHSPAYSVPAMLKPRLEQKAIQPSFVIVAPLKLLQLGRERGLRASTKQPA